MHRKTVFWVWLPLALSFTFMMMEAPVSQTAVSRLPDAAQQLAAFGMVLSLSILIETPVIMLISTAIALGRDRHSFRILSRFTTGLNLALTALSILVAFTPLYDAITRGLLGVPAEVAEAGRPAMQLLIFWTAVIGWRRFFQGILVRFGYSRYVSIGTGIRLATISLVAVGLVLWGNLPGAVVGAIVVMSGVAVELIVTYLFVRPVLRRHLSTTDPTLPPLTYASVARFHAPLASSSLLTLLVQPLTAAALARLASPTISLAAWPVVFGLQLVLRGSGLVLQEVTVALAQQQGVAGALRRFTLGFTALITALTALLVWTPLLDAYLYGVAGVPPGVGVVVAQGMQLALLVPGLTALASWLRGVQVARGATSDVNWAMGLNVLVSMLILGSGLALRAPGIPLAALALTLALVAETCFLYWRAFVADTRPATRANEREAEVPL
jgi:progressive ankylosis protein